MRGRIILAAAVAAAAALLAAAPASAKQEYPPVDPDLTANPTTVVAGGTTVVTGTGFLPDEDVVITVATTPLAAPQIGVDESTQETVAMVPAARTAPIGRTAVFPPTTTLTVTADDEGGFTVTILLKIPGVATITATGEESGESASVTVTVLPKPFKKGLPETGTNLWRLVWIGGGGTIAGGILLLTGLAWRARREQVDA